MRGPNRGDLGLLVGWCIAIGTAGLIAYTFAQTPLSGPIGSESNILRITRATLVLVLVLIFTVLLVTRMRRAEQGDQESRLLLEMAGGGLLLLDDRYEIRFANGGASAIFQLTESELRGRVFVDLFPPTARPELARLLTGANSSASSPVLQLEGRRADGRLVPVQLAVRSALVQGRLVLGVQLNDLTEREELASALASRAAELARSNRELEQFAYIASHDLQEPLRMVASYTQLLQQRYQDKLDADANEFLGFAREGATRMRQLIDDLLAYSRVGTRGQQFRRVSAETCLSEALTNLTGAITANAAVVEHGPLPEVEVDATQLAQVFQNLIGNALKFHGPTPPVIRVSAERQGEMWRFAVHDNGIGILPEYQQRIFVIFQRLHSREEYPGSGIGLSICEKVVERHGGRIWVESTGVPGEGTTFFFTLPVERAAVVPKPPVEVEPAADEIGSRARMMIEERLKQLA